MTKVVQLSEAELRSLVLNEAKKLKGKKGKKGKDPVEKGGDTGDVKPKELKDGGDYAETLAMKVDHKRDLKKEDKQFLEALSLEEERLVRRIKEVRSLKSKLAKK
jgi:hypothetical protein